MAKRDKFELDERGLLGKTMEGDFKAYNLEDGVNAGTQVTGLLGPWGDVVGAPGYVVSGAMEANRKESWFSDIFGIKARRAARRSRMLEEHLGVLDGLPLNRGGSAAAMTAGAFGASAAVTSTGVATTAGAAVGSAICPIAGTVVGGAIGLGSSMIGGGAAAYLYNMLLGTGEPQAVALVIKMMQAQKQGATDIPPEMAFATLASNLHERQRAPIERELKKLTGKKLHEALANALDPNAKDSAKCQQVLTGLMHKYDHVIRHNNGMPLDVANPTKTVSEQYIELVNSGQVDARELLFTRSSRASMAELIRQAQQQQMSVLPDSQEALAVGQNMAQMGIAPTPSGATQELPPTGRQKELG